MALDFDADLDLMLSTDEFAVDVTVGASTIAGIFDAEYAEIDAGGMPMESVAPAVAVKSSAVATHSIVEGTAITIAGVGYVVVDVRTDGVAVGMSVLRLNRS